MKVLFIDSVHSILWSRLTDLGFICTDVTNKSQEEILPVLNDFDGLVIRSKFKLTRELLKQNPNIKFIARAGSGLENIDLEFCKNQGIQVFSSPEGNRDAVAEHATGMLLMLLNKLKLVDSQVRAGVWERAENRGFELKDKVVGLIGYGVMGKAFAQRLSGFGCKVIAYDKYLTSFSDEYAQQVDLETLQREANVVSLHVNYLEENKYLVDGNFISQFQKPFYLINTARGFNVNTNELVAGLQNKKVLGACLDVLEFEAVSFEAVPKNNSAAFEYLKSAQNVILSPHIAGWTHESYVKLSSVLADKIEMWITGNYS